MLNYLEELLKEKTKEKKEEVLYKQWQLAKDYVPNVLATISNVFPHYTLHDRTHSEAILTNIGRILGKETLEKFSSIDLWLLLCAAFYHDIGMAAFACDLDKILKEDDFLLYLREIQADSNNALYTQASYFEISGNKIKWKDSDVTLEKIEALKFIVAEYIRYNHSERSESALKNDPSINLPNNPIPSRLIRMLGKICECHTESFEKVMELPFEEAGIEYEPCHPRFIACLLRLGDLLDLDNNRISNIVLRTIKTIPAESFFHIQKHLSISRLEVNTKQIEITAECKKEEYKTADLASSWFSWLDKEITDQMKNWNQIVPNPDFGFLPTVGNLKVELNGYDSIDGKVHPKFEIDSQKAIEMLQGANLYSEPFQSIRELLQNSVDATYLRIWVENKDSDITFEKFKDKCQEDNYAIQITIDKKSSDDEKVVWHITISDSGIGMSKEDLKFLYKTGSSSQNKEKQKYLSEMPEWMKPSGTFGIGFQSIFLLTDEVHIKTRKYNSGDEYDIDLYNPTGEDNGTILLKTIKNSNFKIGTEVSFDLFEHLSDDDFIKSESLDLVDNITNAIEDFAEASYQKIKLNGSKLILNVKKINFSYYSEKTNLAICIVPDIPDKYVVGISNYCSVFYRNQLVKESSLRFHFLRIDVNILGGNAKKVLTLNRNEINSQYYETLCKNTIITVMEYLKNNFSKMSAKQKACASAFAYVYSDIVGIKNDESEIFTKWKEYPIIVIENEKITEINIGRLIQKFDSVKILTLNKRNKEKVEKYRRLYKHNRIGTIINFYCMLEKKSLVIYNDYYSYNINMLALLFKAISPYFCFSNYEYDNGTIILSKTENLPRINKQVWESWLYLTRNLTNTRVIPCNPEYIKLAINTTIHGDRFFGDIMELFPKMVSPYIFDRSTKLLKKDMTEKLIDFVFRNRKDETVTKEEIIETYEKFIKDSESAINEINK